MEYETRHMEALKPMYYQGESLAVGDCFYATPIDASYFVRHARAREISMPASLSGLTQSEPPAQEVKTAAEPESPVAAEQSLVEVESHPGDSPAEGTGPADVEAAEKPAEAPADPVVTAAPRRGRPPRAAAAVETPDPQA